MANYRAEDYINDVNWPHIVYCLQFYLTIISFSDMLLYISHRHTGENWPKCPSSPVVLRCIYLLRENVLWWTLQVREWSVWSNNAVSSDHSVCCLTITIRLTPQGPGDANDLRVLSEVQWSHDQTAVTATWPSTLWLVSKITPNDCPYLHVYIHNWCHVVNMWT